MRPVTNRFITILAFASIAVLGIAASASAAFTASPTRTFAMGSLYAPAPDGTFWETYASGSGGTAVHKDDEGNDLGDGFSFNFPGYFPLGIGAYGGRVYLTVSGGSFGGPRLISYLANSVDPGHNYLPSDEGTNRRIGGNQAMLRVFADGGIAIALGQENKVGILNGTDLSAGSPYYPQSFHGAGINQSYDPAKVPYGMESCVLGLGAGPVFGEPSKCGQFNGYSGETAPTGLAYPNDVAPGPGGLYVTEKDGDRVTYLDTVSQPGAVFGFGFGIGPGSAGGHLDEPQSIVRQPSTGNLFVSEGGNRRISVFTPSGGFLAAFGYGVLSGADELQVCGFEIGPCQAGVPYQSDPRSYFGRLDFGPDGELFAYMPVSHQIQVFQVSGLPAGTGGGGTTGGGSTGGSGGGSTGTPGTPGSPTAPAEKDKVRLKAEPLKVKKGAKTKLTAIVNPPATCSQRTVLFQLKDSKGWDNLGKAIKPGKACLASKRVTVNAKSVFRAVLIAASSHKTLGYSPNVTVKLK